MLLDRLASLRWWSFDDGWLTLGAGVALRELRHPSVGGVVPIVSSAAAITPPDATIGSCLLAAGPVAAALAARGGTARLRCDDGERDVALTAFVLGAGRDLGEDEVLTYVRVPARGGPQALVSGARHAVALVADVTTRDVRVIVTEDDSGAVRARAAEGFAATVVDWSSGRCEPACADQFAALVGAAAGASAARVARHAFVRAFVTP